MVIKKSPKEQKQYSCECCDYLCYKNSDYIKHLLTPKHIGNASGNEKIANKIFKCKFCNKIYKSNKGLWGHNKICISKNDNIVIHDASSNEIKVLTNLVLEVVKTNTELQKQNHDLQKQMVDVCQKIQPSSTINSNNTITNSHNKTFNLQFFLNEQCKDAMNIKDFVKSIKIEMSDLERLGKEGYVEGISRIIIERLKEMDIYKRPLHCSDAKRETMYIKENDVWNKDESLNNEKMIEFIKDVEQRNYTSLLAYADEYPEVYKQESKRNVPYLHMAIQSNGTAEKINKVMKRIIKEVVIDKEKQIS
jgi:hypothetical protein